MADLVLDKIDPEKKDKKISPERKIDTDKNDNHTNPKQGGQTITHDYKASPKKPSTTAEQISVTSPERQNSRHVPTAIRQALWQRAKGQCEYVHAESGRRCEAKSHLEVDHVHPWSTGGRTEINNLRILCSSHNKTAAVHALGGSIMQVYLPTLK